MPVTMLAAVLGVLLAAEPEAATATSTSTATPTATPVATDAEWVTGAGEPPPSAPVEPRPPLPPMPHSLSYVPPHPPDYALAAGWGTTDLMGVNATGTEVTFEATLPLARPSRTVFPVFSAELFVGETAPGLAIRSVALGGELWTDLGRVRLGGGIGSGVIAYSRATNGEWSPWLTCGVRAGIEATVLRVGGGGIVLGAHGSASIGPWMSGHLTIGYRWTGTSR
jgi:hypothetical protein